METCRAASAGPGEIWHRRQNKKTQQLLLVKELEKLDGGPQPAPTEFASSGRTLGELLLSRDLEASSDP